MFKGAYRAFALTLTCVMLIACDRIAGTAPAGLAIVDLDAIARATGQDEVLRQLSLQARGELETQLQQQVLSLEAQLEKAREELGESPTDEEAEQFEQRTAQAQQQFANMQLQARQQAQVFDSALIDRFRGRIELLVEPLARDQEITAVFIADTGLLWVTPESDFTDEVIATLRADPSLLEEPAEGQRLDADTGTNAESASP